MTSTSHHVDILLIYRPPLRSPPRPPLRQVPVAADGLAPCLGDVALVRVVTRECGDRAATVLEKHLREKSVASWAAAGAERWGGALAGAGGGGGSEGGGGEGGQAATAKALGQADALLDELALLTQHTESYDRFVRFLVEEVMMMGGVHVLEGMVGGGVGYVFVVVMYMALFCVKHSKVGQGLCELVTVTRK